MYIAIAGNIGSGKSTLTQMLAEHYNARAHFEEPDNPYIGDFYEDMGRWSFNLQIYFLSSRIKQTTMMLNEAKELCCHTIQDRTIYEDAYIFARNLTDMGLMTHRDFRSYMNCFSLFESFVPRPDLLIYLKASVPKLKEQILLRGREYECNIENEYLECLDRHYSEWIKEYEGDILVIDVDNENFKSDAEAFARICRYIDDFEAKK